MLRKELESGKDTSTKQVEIFCMDEFVPKDHLLRKINETVDFTPIYDFVEGLYCPNNGRPSIDPIVLYKMSLIQYLYGIPSLRRTVEEIKMNVACRWFLGYGMYDTIPHFSTLSYNFAHRYTQETTEQIFNWILDQINNEGYLHTQTAYIDGSHTKASANLKKSFKEQIPQEAKIYADKLFEEINEDRELHGKEPFEEKPLGDKTVTVSKTDPDCGVFSKGEHKRCFAYTASTACDKNGYVMAVTVNPGNVNDSVAFDELYESLTEKFPEIQEIVADGGYKTAWIAKRIIDDGRIPVLPYTRPGGKKGFYKTHEFTYDEEHDCIICPENQILSYSTTNRDGKRVYKSDRSICANCPNRYKCTENSKCEKTIELHLWHKYLESVEKIRLIPEYADLYKNRKETIERVFGDAKEKHGMRYTQLRGLNRVTNEVRLRFVAMNLKKYVLHKCRPKHKTKFADGCPLSAMLADCLSAIFCNFPLFRRLTPTP